MNRLRPTDQDLEAAAARTVPDVIAPGLRVLFCGINPSLYTAAVGYHFARPGNRFWRALHASGFTNRLLAPEEARLLPALGLGITNVVARATTSAAELSKSEFKQGGRALEAKVRRYKPGWLAVLGIGAYRTAFERPHAGVGAQVTPIGGARVWVLPNPSGLNAHYPPAALAELFRELRRASEEAEA